MVNYSLTIRRIANTYYNLGLERAKYRDLSGAAELLKKALRFNKYQTDARNLLGLIYYEMGEVGDALIQWVISLNLQPSANRADYYLDNIQRNKVSLEICSQQVKKFNQALYQAQHGGEDLAILQLNRIIEETPHFVKAHILLALLYMQKEDNVRAGRSLYKVLRIDRNNPKALVLMHEVKKRTGKAEVERNKLKNAFSHRQMEDDDVILPEVKKQATAGQMVLYMCAGFILSLLAFVIIILPSVRREINVNNNQDIVDISGELSEKTARLNDLEESYASLQSQFNDVSTRLNAYEQENADFLSLYQKLNSITAAYTDGDIVQAANDYLSIDPAGVTEEPMSSMYNEVMRYMQSEGWQRVCELGTQSWNGGDMTQAEAYYNLSLQLRPDEPETMFLLGRLYQSQNRTEEANALFDKIVGEHPESSYAERAQTARGY